MNLEGLLKFKSYLIILVVVIIIIAAIYFYGKKAGTTKIEQVPLPNDSGTGKQLTNDEATQVRQISNDLHSDMKGWNIWSHNLEPYRKLMNLSDTLFVAVYNDFNTLYSAEGQTLRQWLEGEKWITLGIYTPFSELKSQVLDRMKRLNLQ